METYKRRSKSSSIFSLRSSKDVTWEPKKKRLRGKLLFKSNAKKVIQFREWLKEIDNYSSGVIATGIGVSKKTLPLEAKIILIKYPTSRTEDEQQELEGLLSGLYFYNKYPEKEYKQLIGKTICTCYGTGRIVFRQDQPLTDDSRLYYVVDGYLSVGVATVDPITLSTHVELVKKLGPGDQFGDTAIIFNENREATVTTLTDVILLNIKKKHFDAILKESLEKEWGLVRKATDELPYFFGDWTDSELRRCSIISELITFQEGDLILGDGFGKSKKAHFVIEGKCSMIQDIEVEEKNGQWKMISNKENDKLPENSVRREHVYLQTGVFSSGACFGVGEKLNNRRYVAESDVKCLLVPQYLLLSHTRFETYKQFLETRLFSTDQLYSSFLYSKRKLDYQSKSLNGSKAIPGNDEKINGNNFNLNLIGKLARDEEKRQFRETRRGAGDFPVRKSQSRIMAELSKRITDRSEGASIMLDEHKLKNNATEVTVHYLKKEISILLADLSEEIDKRRNLEHTLADGLDFCFKLEKQKHNLRKRLANSKNFELQLQKRLSDIENENRALEELVRREEYKYETLRIEMIKKKHGNIDNQMKIFEMEREIDCLKSELNRERLDLLRARNEMKILQSKNVDLQSENELTRDHPCNNSMNAIIEAHQNNEEILSMTKKRSPSINDTTIWDVPHLFRVKSPKMRDYNIPNRIPQAIAKKFDG